MELGLANHVAFITGGASGIGRATAAGFAAEGAAVAIVDRAATASEVAAELAGEFGVKTIGITADVTQEPEARAAVERTIAELGDLEHIVHCAAVGSGKFGFPFTNLAPQDWRSSLEVNIMGMVNVAHSVVDHLRAARKGTICFLASVAGQIGSQTDPPYSAAKAANINFAQCVAKDLAPFGIRVNTICPGMVQTPLNQAVWQAWHDQQPPELRKSYADWAGDKVKHIVPLQRWQTPEDIADMIVFLSSERAKQVTGQTINVDGGFVMHW